MTGELIRWEEPEDSGCFIPCQRQRDRRWAIIAGILSGLGIRPRHPSNWRFR